MTLYNDTTFEQSQELIPTSRRAFAAIVVGAYLFPAFILSWTATEMNEDDLISFISYSFLWAPVLGLMGVVLAAPLVLVFGGKLSRQFCWIFATGAGVLAVPLGVFTVTVMMAISKVDFLRGTFGLKIERMSAFAIPAAALASAISGIVIGIRLTRNRRGFAAASARIARIAFAISLPIAILLVIGMIMREQLPSVAMIYIVLCGGFLLSCSVISSIFALARAERFVSRSFEVLPVIPVVSSEER